MDQFQTGNFKNSAKRMRTLALQDVDDRLLDWFRRAVADKIEGLTGHLLQEQAMRIAKELQISDELQSKIDSNWIQRWKNRHDVVQRKISGEAAVVTPEMTNDWLQKTLPAILERFSSNDVYNLDETALFWKLLPDRTLAFRGQKCSGGKHSKVRVTVLVGANMTGTEKLPLLVIGKAQRPRCFKNSQVPVEYVSNKTAWMTSAIFEAYLRGQDRKFRHEKRKVCFIVDNCPSHSTLRDLKAIELIFLPKNTTSHLQPMDAGVIKMLKTQYRTHLMKQKLFAYNTDTPFEVDLLQALSWLQQSWTGLSATKIANCFAHCGFVKCQEAILEEPTEEAEKEFRNLFEKFKDVGLLLMNTSIDIESYSTVDENVVTTDSQAQSEPSTSEDLEATGGDPDSEVLEVQYPTPSPIEAAKSVTLLQRFVLSAGGDSQSLAALKVLHEFVEKESIERRQQKKITDYFVQL